MNASGLLAEAGITLSVVSSTTSLDYRNRLTVRGEQRSLTGTLIGLRDEARIIQIDDHVLDVPPSAHLLIVRNDDRPGVIGAVGTILGNAAINIDNMDVGRTTSTPGVSVGTRIIVPRL